MKKFSFSPNQLRENHSGTFLSELRKAGYESKPIVKFGNTEYMILHQPTIRPGRQTAEVLNVTEFNKDSKFAIARDGRGDGFVVYEDEGWAVLAVFKDDTLYEYTNPFTAVLTYRVEPPTRDDAEQTADEMDDELQNNIDNGGSLKLH